MLVGPGTELPWPLCFAYGPGLIAGALPLTQVVAPAVVPQRFGYRALRAEYLEYLGLRWPEEKSSRIFS